MYINNIPCNMEQGTSVGEGLYGASQHKHTVCTANSQPKGRQVDYIYWARTVNHSSTGCGSAKFRSLHRPFVATIMTQ